MSQDSPTGSLSLDAIPRVVENLDWSSLQLSREEGFLLSRIDGKMTLGELIRLSGMESRKALDLLFSLRSNRVITWLDGWSADSRLDSPGAPWEAEDFRPEDMDPNVDLPLGLQKRILYLYGKKNELTHYQILGVARQATAKEIKRAYFQVSKDFHPDTYFRKSLGSFMPKVVALFKRISQAYEILSDKKKRASYDAGLPYEPTPEELDQRRRQEQQRRQDDGLKKERRRRLLKRTSLAKRRAQARTHYADAKRYRDDNDLLKAANSVRLALALVPDDPEFNALLEEVGPKADEIRAESEFKRGRYEESMGNEEDALIAYLRAIECNPNESRALYRAAGLMLGMKRDIKTALTFCRKAQKLEPDSMDVCRTLADLYLEAGMYKNALREYRRYLLQNPFDEAVQKKVEDLRKR